MSEEYDSESQESDGFCLHIKNIPQNAFDDDMLIMYLENVTGEDNISVDEKDGTETEALVYFEQPQLTSDEAVEKISQTTKLLSGKKLSACFPEENKRLMVTNIKPNATEELVLLHFESKQVIDDDDVEVTVEFDDKARTAIVSFSDISVVDRALNAEHRSRLGPDVVVEKCGYFTSLTDSVRPQRHEHESGNDDDGGDDDDDDDGNEDDGGSRYPVVNDGSPASPVARSSADVSEAGVQGTQQRGRGRGGADGARQRRRPRRRPNHSARGMYSGRGNTGYGGAGYAAAANAGPSADFDGETWIPGYGAGVSSDHQNHVQNRNIMPLMSVDVGGESESVPGYSRSYSAASGRSRQPRERRPNFRPGYGNRGAAVSFSEHVAGNFVSSAGDFAAVGDGVRNMNVGGYERRPGNGRRNCRNQYANYGGRDSPVSFDGDEYSAVYGGFRRSGSSLSLDSAAGTKPHCREIDVQKFEKCLLLIYHIGYLKKFGCKVIVNKKSSKVFIQGGNVESVNRTEEAVYKKLANMHTRRVSSVSAKFLLKLASGKGMLWVRELLRQNSIRAVFYVDSGCGFLLAADDETAQRADSLLADKVQRSDIPYSESQQSFLQSDGWQGFASNAEKNWLLTVEVVAKPTMVIKLEGIPADVDAAADLLKTLLVDNCVVNDEMTVNNSGELRYLKKYCKDYCKGISGATISFSAKEKKLTISGQTAAVGRVRAAVEEQRKKLQRHEFTTDVPGITAALFEDEDEIPAMTIDKLQKEHHCIIEVAVSATSVYASPSHSVSVRVDNSGVEVVQGDITRFDKITRSGDKTMPVLIKNTPLYMLTASLMSKEMIDHFFWDLWLNGLNSVRLRLAMYQADVLVNSVASDSGDLNEAGAVSKAFLKVGGAGLQQEYRTNGGARHNGCTVTSATGSLRAKNVFHVHIRKYVPKQGCIKALHSLIQDCLKRALSMGMSSIAFPTIGCGYMHYPAHKVAKCFTTAVSHFHSIKVYVVAYDADMTKKFQQLLHSGHHHSSSPSPVRSTQTSKQLVKFTIVGTDRGIFDKVEDQLKRKLVGFVHKRTVAVPGDLDPSIILQLQQLKSPGVNIVFNSREKVVELAGNESDVQQAQASVHRLLQQRDCQKNDLKHIKRTKSRREYLDAFCRTGELEAPDHWKQHRAHLDKASTDRAALTVADSTLTRAVTNLVMATWNGSLVGQGRDAVNLGHSSIQVKKVMIVENVKLYRSYVTAVKELYLQKPGGKVPPVQGLAGEDEVSTIVKSDKELKELLLMPEMNECFLFHGTSADKKDAVINQGIDFRLGNPGMFGRGCYFAESSTKADQYADNKQARVGPGHSLYMLVFRVVLGHTFICQQPRDLKRPPCTDSGCHSDTCSHVQHFDSVIATHNVAGGGVVSGLMRMRVAATQGPRLLFREFIVYENSKCYPEFLIEYVRV